MYFSDLSSYSYMLPWPLDSVLNVGWLDEKHPYQTGRVDSVVVDKLRWLAREHAVRRTRGLHQCPFCAYKGHEPNVNRPLGMAEVWVPRAGGFFAAPELVIHYIQAHGYCPPDAFLNAVRSVEIDGFSHDLESEVRALIDAEAVRRGT
jgi:hypothetical protein